MQSEQFSCYSNMSCSCPSLLARGAQAISGACFVQRRQTTIRKCVSGEAVLLKNLQPGIENSTITASHLNER
ncbi:hypothetical protein E5E91_07990 [Deinococcus radiodurans R1 = ATCC 13939 = DSM 20539]|uniref:Uncharacterized protein n=1 Tax=Deinococcus radiodurans (strain ATCC 13939 / DSM 20539 / JCM 16871 / CCUG 27074 / LMG 4051 / NBRC 15346 / NCIMB 9279 / VKM B-1422 / R1) TaxID=243230 RepID=Q9RU47_DEIRA|nr:hypothetical protein DR_1547 [Deinococcus radiodurans R1 = ATCC 13939 = DSM 20539]QEM70987.1 hypothetical protein DXG80_03905 [Deinococcus radiodurans]UDL00641.1 hypothetical protein E5E91_07990 [Deinococcus radiodurans R1 = ATCC 13939 = DSM 20539]HCE63718.1 hypothetical protein [Deinococcus radiodurans]